MQIIRNKFKEIFKDIFYVNGTLSAVIWVGNLVVLAIYLKSVLEFNSWQISYSMFVITFVGRASRIFTSNIIHLFSYKKIILVSYILLTLGFLGLTLFKNFYIILFMLFIIGLAYGSIIIISVMVIGNQQKNSTIAYANLYTGVYLAITITPPIVSYLFSINKLFPMFLLAFLSFLFFLFFLFDKSSGVKIPEQQGAFKSFVLIVKKEYFYIFICIAFWIFANTGTSFLPLTLSTTFQQVSLVGWFFALYGLIVAILSKWLNVKLHFLTSYQKISLSFIFLSIAYTMAYLLPTIIGLFIYISFIALATVLSLPNLLSLISDGKNDSLKSMFFAINALCAGIGEGLGNVLGVYMANLFHSFNFTILLWIAFVCLFISFILYKYERIKK